jgi:restriction endonuclease S subunit
MRQGWITKKLADVCNKASSNVSQNQLSNDNGEYPIFGASGLIKNVSFFHQSKPYLSIVKDGSGVGRVTKMDAFTSVIGTLQYILPNEGIDLDYLNYSLMLVDFKKYVAGAAIPHIYFKDYKDEPFLWMPLPEQQRIVFILDEAFDAISRAKSNAEQNLKNARELFESYLQAVFENKGNAWEEKLLGEIAKVIGGYSFKSSDFKKEGRYQVLRKTVISGNPDAKHISTSYVERSNLTMRMHMRRFTRLTNGFSKKVDNHCYAIALHFVYYNFVKIHKTLRVPPAMEAGLIKRLMTIEDIVKLADK